MIKSFIFNHMKQKFKYTKTIYNKHRFLKEKKIVYT